MNPEKPLDVYLGLDVGSVSTKLAALDQDGGLLASLYSRTQGHPIAAIQKGLAEIRDRLPAGAAIRGVGTTGSARELAGVIVGADIVKNEITSQAVAALRHVPEARTIIEIGGQDSKIIILRDGVVVDFGMNTVCAAGTGSFLDHQALRLKMEIGEFGPRALRSRNPVRIAGRCTVFAESDMIHKQQMGHPVEDILYGLCQALVRNYLNNIGSGKEIRPPVVFQGGVAFNQGMVRALRESLETEIIVPPHHEVMGAIGAALIGLENARAAGNGTRFLGFGVVGKHYEAASFECPHCANHCEIARISSEGTSLACWGGRCDRWN